MSVYIKFIKKIDSDNVTDQWFMEQPSANFLVMTITKLNSVSNNNTVFKYWLLMLKYFS